jgi:predicted transcriptional regulator
MLRTPCEFMNWQGLPIIRKELVNSLINNYGLNQKEAAEKMGITPAAVCQYLSKKRGRIAIVNRNILFEIDTSAQKIVEHGVAVVPDEICRICKLLREHNLFSFSVIEK